MEPIHGNNENNSLWGSPGNDTINGHGGNDTLGGGAGNDDLYGGSGNDLMFGHTGNDYFNGGSGFDSMHGSRGNDTYVVDSFGDQVFENTGEGTDIVYSYLNNYVLADNVEQLLLSSPTYSSHGNNLSNIIGGNPSDNYIWGGSGGNDTIYSYGGDDILIGSYDDAGNHLDAGPDNDLIIGSPGNDYIDGGSGNDTIEGGLGSDIMYAGNGYNIFEYHTISHSPTNQAPDIIYEFNPRTDKIDLSGIDADVVRRGNQSFTFIGRSQFTSGVRGQVRYDTIGNSVLIQADIHGNKTPDFHVHVIGFTTISESSLLGVINGGSQLDFTI